MLLVKKTTLIPKKMAANRRDAFRATRRLRREMRALAPRNFITAFIRRGRRHKKMSKMEIDPAMCMKTQGNRQTVYSKNVPFYTKSPQTSGNRRKSVGFVGQRCRSCPKKTGRSGANLLNLPLSGRMAKGWRRGRAARDQGGQSLLHSRSLPYRLSILAPNITPIRR